MRTVIFLVGVVLVVLGPLLTLFAFSSCLETILSGHILACLSDLGFVVFGGLLFLVGVIVAIVGVVAPDAYSGVSPHLEPPVSAQPVQVTCKKCGRVYSSGLFFCPSCGQRPG